MSIIKLYHGSNVVVEKPQIFKSDRKLDFGTGFYLTSDFEQASKWAILTTMRRKQGNPIISVYDIEEDAMLKLNILKFDCANLDWLKFITANRKNIVEDNNFDIVIGPVANDNTMPVINLYFSNIYDEEETLKRLLPQRLKDQYTFKTYKALENLKFYKEVRL